MYMCMLLEHIHPKGMFHVEHSNVDVSTLLLNPLDSVSSSESHYVSHLLLEFQNGARVGTPGVGRVDEGLLDSGVLVIAAGDTEGIANEVDLLLLIAAVPGFDGLLHVGSLDPCQFSLFNRFRMLSGEGHLCKLLKRLKGINHGTPPCVLITFCHTIYPQIHSYSPYIYQNSTNG